MVDTEKLIEFEQSINMTEVGSLKNIVSGLLEVINDPMSTVRQLKEIIELDPPLLSKVLSVANSAHYGLRSRVTEIEQAVIWIGFEELKQLALQQKLRSILNLSDGSLGQQLWYHAVSVAMLSKMMFRRELGLRGEMVYAVSLLHDLGFLLMQQQGGERFEESLQLIHSGMNVFEAQKQVFGFNHLELTAHLIKSWEMPTEFEQVLLHLVSPELCKDDHLRRMARVVYVSLYLVHSVETGPDFYTVPINRERLMQCIGPLGLDRDSVNLIVEDMVTEFNKLLERGLL